MLFLDYNFEGRSEEVDLPFVKSVLKTEDFNQFKTNIIS